MTNLIRRLYNRLPWIRRRMLRANNTKLQINWMPTERPKTVAVMAKPSERGSVSMKKAA